MKSIVKAVVVFGPSQTIRTTAEPVHSLRILVGYANMLDILNTEIYEAKYTNKRLINHPTVNLQTKNARNTGTTTGLQHVRWADLNE